MCNEYIHNVKGYWNETKSGTPLTFNSQSQSLF